MFLHYGFRIVWTEIQDSGPGPPSIGLLCESTYHFQCEGATAFPINYVVMVSKTVVLAMIVTNCTVSLYNFS
ncbi:unnamed protein product [Ceratitis capitata]|uniref:(Mediterranean fruit fly) hypothetical protein n=1 Tax=Ceratitis capitata TaxID=7213 RepID=A0A811UAP8_CERCA|nr:unnamed protein product [Ceratitis capitata]